MEESATTRCSNDARGESIGTYGECSVPSVPINSSEERTPSVAAVDRDR